MRAFLNFSRITHFKSCTGFRFYEQNKIGLQNMRTSYWSTRNNSSSAPEIPKPLKDRKVCIYMGPLKNRIKIVKILSLSSSGMGLCVLPFALSEIGNVSQTIAGLTALMSAGFLATPLILNWITKRYVIELNYNTDTKVFTAKVLNIFNQVKEIKFTPDDVTVPDIPGILTSIIVKDKPIFVDATMVRDTEAYCYMMGYDKPIDLRVDCEKAESKSS